MTRSILPPSAKASGARMNHVSDVSNETTQDNQLMNICHQAHQPVHILSENAHACCTR
jgi:hypothetical protein